MSFVQVKDSLTQFKEFASLSGITDETAEKAHLRLSSKLETEKYLGYPVVSDSAEVPYFGVDGEPTGFARYRVFNAIGKGKYRQKKGSGVNIYFNPLRQDWKQIRKNLIPIVFVEGEKKALCLQQYYNEVEDLNVAVIGLGGVDMFVNTDFAKDKARMHDDLAAFEWAGRTVFVGFDNDNPYKTEVLAAGGRLTGMLLAQKAQVHMLKWEIDGVTSKLGPDDFVVHGGDPVTALLNAESNDTLVNDLPPSAKVLQFNANYTVIAGLNKIMNMETGTYHSWADFPMVEPMEMYVEGPEGKPGKWHNCAKLWLRSRYRNTVRSLELRPDKQKGLFNEGGHDYLNLWHGYPHAPSDSSPELSDFAKHGMVLWHQLVDQITTTLNFTQRLWFDQRIAHMFQQPAKRAYTGMIIKSIHHGCGKSLLVETLAQLAGDHGIVGDDGMLSADFNSELAGMQVVVFNEVGDGKSRSARNRIKSMMTDEKMKISTKHVSQYYLLNLMNLFITSNEVAPLGLENHDRRWFVIEVPLHAGITHEHGDKIAAWLRANNGEGYRALLQYYLDYDTEGFHPTKKPPETDAKKFIIETSESKMIQWGRELKAGALPMMPNKTMLTGPVLHMYYMESTGDRKTSLQNLLATLSANELILNVGAAAAIGNKGRVTVGGARVTAFAITDDYIEKVKKLINSGHCTPDFIRNELA